MKFEIHIHHHHAAAPGADLSSIIGAIQQGADEMSEALDRLKTEVSENTDAVQAAITSIKGMAQIIRDNANDPEALNDLADKLDAQSKELLDTVVANTPSDLPN